jgi:hypothetical protein
MNQEDLHSSHVRAMILNDLRLDMNDRVTNQYPTTSLLQWYGNLTAHFSCDARRVTRNDQGPIPGSTREKRRRRTPDTMRCLLKVLC